MNNEGRDVEEIARKIVDDMTGTAKGNRMVREITESLSKERLEKDKRVQMEAETWMKAVERVQNELSKERREKEELQKRIEGVRKRLDKETDLALALAGEVNDKDKEIAALEEKVRGLSKYATHTKLCRNKLYKGGWTCTCGFADIESRKDK